MDETKNATTEEGAPMFDQIEGELKTRFELLPSDLQKVILSPEYQAKLFELAKKHALTYEKLGQLELETTMVLLGMTPPDEYKADIADQLGLTGATLEELVEEINHDIFVPIREQLIGLYTKEEVELGEKFSSVSTATTETPNNSPYREPIAPKNTPNLNTGAIPTLDKNEFDSKTEVGLNPTKISSTFIQTLGTQQTPPVAIDPYRELPTVGANVPNITPTPNTVVSTPIATLTPDFLQKIPTLEANSEKFTEAPPSALGFDRNFGGLETMNQTMSQKTLAKSAPTPKTPSETLKGIAALKSALMGDIIKTKETYTPPVVTKEEIIVTQTQAQTVPQTVPPTPTPTVNQNSFNIAPIAQKTISLDNVSQNLPGETYTAMTPHTEKETSELMRNIKLQLDETQAALDTQNKNATMQKIDSLIDFKKAGDFMQQGTLIPQPKIEEQNSSIPTQQKFTGDILDKSTTSGQIYDQEIDSLRKNVKKTGFFSKMKNFFGNDSKTVYQDDAPVTMPSFVAPQTPTPVQMNTVSTPQNMNSAHMPQAPVNDTDVDNVKIFDEVTIQKK